MMIWSFDEGVDYRIGFYTSLLNRALAPNSPIVHTDLDHTAYLRQVAATLNKIVEAGMNVQLVELAQVTGNADIMVDVVAWVVGATNALGGELDEIERAMASIMEES
jgi:hypothetical protein